MKSKLSPSISLPAAAAELARMLRSQEAAEKPAVSRPQACGVSDHRDRRIAALTVPPSDSRFAAHRTASAVTSTATCGQLLHDSAPTTRRVPALRFVFAAMWKRTGRVQFGIALDG